MLHIKSLFVFIIILYSAVCLGQSTTNNPSIKNGKTVYATFCMSCHMEDGKGLPAVYPSLVQTGNLKDKNKLVQIILKGMRGPINVKGEKYDTEMAGVDLTDKEVADVINYIRNSWGNKAPLIKTAEVAPAKKIVIKGYQPF